MKHRRGHRRILSATALAVLLGAAAASVSAQGIFTCLDKNGRRLTSDRPIAECADREQKELNPSGTVKRNVGPSLTAQERAALEDQQRKEAEERARQAEERRRDRALLSRYRDRAAHDKERADALKQVDEVIATAKRRVTDLQGDRKKLDIEMEFYAADPNKAPVALKRKIADTDTAIETQKRFMVDQEAGKSRINARFDEELARLKVLWSAAGAAPTAASPSPAPAR